MVAIKGPLFRRAMAKIMAQVNVEIVKRSDHAKRLLPSRPSCGWVVSASTPRAWTMQAPGQGLGKSSTAEAFIPTSQFVHFRLMLKAC